MSFLRGFERAARKKKIILKMARSSKKVADPCYTASSHLQPPPMLDPVTECKCGAFRRFIIFIL